MAAHKQFTPQFICGRRKYTNSLPIDQLSCPPKFMNFPFQNIERHSKCGITKLEEEYKYEVWPEDILKNCPPLVDLNIFKRDENAVMNEKDVLLLGDDFAVGPTNSKRSQQHSKIVPWMRKTEYISTEFNRFGVNADRSEIKVGYNIKKKMGNQDTMYKDQNSQIAAIKKSFDVIGQPIKKHYSKPGVHAVEEIMILPDEEQSKYSYAQVIFDADPMSSMKDSTKLQERTILKGMKDQDGNNFVAYFVPTDETLQQKLKEESEGADFTAGQEYKYTCGREYNWTVQSRGIDVEAYFFTQRNGVMYYCEMDTRVKLNRRAKLAHVSRNSILALTHREYTEDELKAMKHRQNKLYDPYITGEYVPLPEEEEEEEESEQESNASVHEANEEAKDSDESGDEKPEEEAKDSDESSDEGEKPAKEVDSDAGPVGNKSKSSSLSSSDDGSVSD